jgi:hypothetical protein
MNARIIVSRQATCQRLLLTDPPTSLRATHRVGAPHEEAHGAGLQVIAVHGKGLPVGPPRVVGHLPAEDRVVQHAARLEPIAVRGQPTQLTEGLYAPDEGGQGGGAVRRLVAWNFTGLLKLHFGA